MLINKSPQKSKSGNHHHETESAVLLTHLFKHLMTPKENILPSEVI